MNVYNIEFWEREHQTELALKHIAVLHQWQFNHVICHGIHSFFTLRRKNIAIQENIILDGDRIPTHYMIEMSKLKEKYEQFQTLITMNIAKLDTS